MAKKHVFVSLPVFWTTMKTEQSAVKKPRLLGLDLGSKTIGIAIADSGLVVASPLHTIRRTKFTADRLELEEFIQHSWSPGSVDGSVTSTNHCTGRDKAIK